MPRMNDCTEVSSPLWATLAIAIAQSGKTKIGIAREIGIPCKQLSRWLKGKPEPTVDDWAAILSVCGVEPLTCMVVAKLGRTDLIRMPSRPYLDKLLPELLKTIIEVENAGEIALDPRAANHDAKMLFNSWKTLNERRERYIEAQYNRLGTLPE